LSLSAMRPSQEEHFAENSWKAGNLYLGHELEPQSYFAPGRECKIPGANPVMPSRKAEKQGTHSVEHRLELVNGKLSRIVQRKHPLQLAPGI
jgi:hypothetical protein